MKIKKLLFIFLIILPLLFSCKKKSEILQENNGITATENTRIINQYKGLWYCEKSDAFQNLLDMGLVLQLGIYTDGKFNIIAVIGDEQELLNTGSWTLSDNMKKCFFTLPDQEYGGTITGTFELKDKKLYYILDESPEQSSVFSKY